MSANKLENYLALLNIRLAGKRRDSVITGGVFIVSLILMIVFGMLENLPERSTYFSAAIIVCLGFAFLTTWVKFEILKGTIEMIDNLLLMEEETN